MFVLVDHANLNAIWDSNLVHKSVAEGDLQTHRWLIQYRCDRVILLSLVSDTPFISWIFSKTDDFTFKLCYRNRLVKKSVNLAIGIVLLTITRLPMYLDVSFLEFSWKITCWLATWVSCHRGEAATSTLICQITTVQKEYLCSTISADENFRGLDTLDLFIFWL